MRHCRQGSDPQSHSPPYCITSCTFTTPLVCAALMAAGPSDKGKTSVSIPLTSSCILASFSASKAGAKGPHLYSQAAIHLTPVHLSIAEAARSPRLTTEEHAVMICRSHTDMSTLLKECSIASEAAVCRKHCQVSQVRQLRAAVSARWACVTLVWYPSASFGSPGVGRVPYLEPCRRFSLTTTSLAMSLHAGMLASLTAEQVLLRTMLPMGLVIALASLMPCDEPEASTTASNACKACKAGLREQQTTRQPALCRAL